MPSKLLLVQAGDSEIVNDATEQTIFTGTVPGGTLGTTGVLQFRMLADFVNNTGAGRYFILRAKYGSQTFHTFKSISNTSDVDRKADFTEIFLHAAGSTGAQRSRMSHKQGGTNSAAGGVGNGNDHNSSVNETITVDSTTDQTFAVTVQLETASSSFAYRRMWAGVEQHTTPLPSAVGDGTQLLTQFFPDLASGEGLFRNSTTETTVWTYDIPANTIGSSNLVIVQATADVRNNSGSSAQWWQRAQLGGTNVFNPTAGTSNTTNALRYSFPVEFWIAGRGTTGTQIIGTLGHAIGTVAGSGEGNLGNTSWQANQSCIRTALDSTTPLTFNLRADFSAANADLDYRLTDATVTVVKP